jgi:2-polyprenyl-6-hydroxyphenyl methylase/3-demethylubiquinone-9 3-methyltransferase
MTENILSEYPLDPAEPCHHNAYLLPLVDRILSERPSRRIFEIGFGHGSTAAHLARQGYDVTGVEPSSSGVAHAQHAYPNLKLYVGSGYDDLAAKFGSFPVVLSLEVIEHVYVPRQFIATVFSLLEPGGLLILSTPYHGYLKNLALALSGRMDAHFTALWDHGHIKFWSIKTITKLLEDGGLHVEAVHRVGRMPVLAKSMVVVARRPVLARDE